MKTIRQVEVTPVFLDGFAPEWDEMKEAHIYISYSIIVLYTCAFAVVRIR